MDVSKILTAIAAAQTALTEVQTQVTAAGVASATVDAPAPTPAPAPVIAPAPKRVYEYDERGLLKGATAAGGVRIDPIVDADCTTAVNVNGSFLSVPRTDLGEMFVGYAGRVSAQAGGVVTGLGQLFLGLGPLFAPYGGFNADGSNWPQAAFAFHNPAAQSAADSAKWDAAARGLNPTQPRTGHAHVRANDGTNVAAPVEVPIT